MMQTVFGATWGFLGAVALFFACLVGLGFLVVGAFAWMVMLADRACQETSERIESEREQRIKKEIEDHNKFILRN